MSEIISYGKMFISIFALCLSSRVFSESASTSNPEAPILETSATASANNVDSTAAVAQKTDTVAKVNQTPAASMGAKKMVQDATINLQTTVTGNQEQPRVLYILPWQSPAPEDVDFESFSNDQRVIFGHVEREELRRELESAGEE